MEIALAEPALVRQIEQWGQATNLPAAQLVQIAVEAYLDELEKEAIRAETQAFWAMYSELVQHYVGRHVALYHGEVVDHDADVSRLDARVRARFGTLPVLIAEVHPEPHRDLRWLGGRIDPSATNS